MWGWRAALCEMQIPQDKGTKPGKGGLGSAFFNLPKKFRCAPGNLWTWVLIRRVINLKLRTGRELRDYFFNEEGDH